MTAIITHQFRLQNLRETKKRLDAGTDLYYLAVGRSEPWPNDVVPPPPEVDPLSGIRARHSLQAAKRIVDFQFAAPRYNWVNGNSYVAYDNNDPDLHTKAFYALNTTSFNVYICLTAGPGPSTVEPTGIDDNVSFGGTPGVAGTSVPQQLADGYRWKYLYTIDAPSASRFLTTDFMPVLRNANVAANAIYGQIWSIDIVSGGAGYSSTPTVLITGDGTGATATATRTGGVITGITITNPGSGYTYAVATLVGGSPATPGVLRPNPSPIAPGREIAALNVVNGGSGYTNGAVDLLISGDGYLAEATGTITGGVLQSATTIVAAGYNYTQATVTVDDGAGNGAEVTVEFGPPVGGFGYDPVTDLLAFYTLMYVVLEGAEGGGDFVPANDYRQLLVIKNPLTTGSQPVAFTQTTGRALRYLTVAPGGTWAQDDIITGGSSGAKAYMNYYDPDLQRVYYHQTETTGFDSFDDGETITGVGVSSGAVAATGGSADGPAEFDVYSGLILYHENRAPVSRAPDQTETIQIAIAW